MRDYRLYILDLDGTLYRGDEVTLGAVETISELRRRGFLIRFLTNNSGRTREFYAEKLNRLGFAAEVSEVHSSATGTAAWLREQGVGTAYVVGEEGLFRALADEGVRAVNEGPEAAQQADAVVVGICRKFNYDWMNSAMQQIRGGARFVATNPDVTYPLAAGRLEPGAGAIVAAVQACSGVEPEVIGKPNPYLVQHILEETGIGAEDTLVVGDRPETDLECGRAAGCHIHLVLCGVTPEAISGVECSLDLRGLL